MATVLAILLQKCQQSCHITCKNANRVGKKAAKMPKKLSHYPAIPLSLTKWYHTPILREPFIFGEN